MKDWSDSCKQQKGCSYLVGIIKLDLLDNLKDLLQDLKSGFCFDACAGNCSEKAKEGLTLYMSLITGKRGEEKKSEPALSEID